MFEARNLVAQMLKREQSALQSLAVFMQGDPPGLPIYLEALRHQADTMNAWLDQQAALHGARYNRGAAGVAWLT